MIQVYFKRYNFVEFLAMTKMINLCTDETVLFNEIQYTVVINIYPAYA